MYSEVKDYCATCPECQLVERKLVNSRAPLNPIEIVTEHFKKVAIDLVGLGSCHEVMGAIDTF